MVEGWVTQERLQMFAMLPQCFKAVLHPLFQPQHVYGHHAPGEGLNNLHKPHLGSMVVLVCSQYLPDMMLLAAQPVQHLAQHLPHVPDAYTVWS